MRMFHFSKRSQYSCASLTTTIPILICEILARNVRFESETRKSRLQKLMYSKMLSESNCIHYVPLLLLFLELVNRPAVLTNHLHFPSVSVPLDDCLLVLLVFFFSFSFSVKGLTRYLSGDRLLPPTRDD